MGYVTWDPPGRTRWEGLLEGSRKEGPGIMGYVTWDISQKDQLGRTWEGGPGYPLQKDQLGRTAGRTWKGGPGYPLPMEGPAAKDCWKDMGRRAWVPHSPLEGPARKNCWKDLGMKAQVPPPPEGLAGKLGRNAARTSTGKQAVCLKKGCLVGMVVHLDCI